MTRGLFLADPRVEPADLAYLRIHPCGFTLFKRTAACRGPYCRAGAPRAGSTDSTRGAENDTQLPKMIQNLPLPARNLLVPGRYSSRMLS